MTTVRVPRGSAGQGSRTLTVVALQSKNGCEGVDALGKIAAGGLSGLRARVLEVLDIVNDLEPHPQAVSRLRRVPHYSAGHPLSKVPP